MLVFSEGKFATISKHVVFYDTLNNKNEEAPSHLLTKQQIEMRRMILNENGLSELE